MRYSRIAKTTSSSTPYSITVCLTAVPARRCAVSGHITCMYQLTLIRDHPLLLLHASLAGFRFAVQPPRLGLHQDRCVSVPTSACARLVFCLPLPEGANSVTGTSTAPTHLHRCCDIRSTVRVSGGWWWLVAAHQTPKRDYGVAGAHRTPASSTNKPPAARCKGVRRPSLVLPLLPPSTGTATCAAYPWPTF